MNLVAKHEVFFLQAVESRAKAKHHLQNAKVCCFDTGLLLISAHAEYEKIHPGEWSTYLEAQKEKMSRATAYRYMDFAKECLREAAESNPRLTDKTKLAVAARDMVLNSLLKFMEISREEGIARAREGGGRRSENHLQNGEQFNFDFGILDDSLWALERNGAAALREVPAAKLQETCTRLETALQLTRTELQGRATLLRSPDPSDSSPGRATLPRSPDPSLDSLPLWRGFRNQAGEITVLPKGHLPTFDSRWYESEPSTAFHAPDAAAALTIAREKIFTSLSGNTPVDNSSPCVSAPLRLCVEKKETL